MKQEKKTSKNSDDSDNMDKNEQEEDEEEEEEDQSYYRRGSLSRVATVNLKQERRNSNGSDDIEFSQMDETPN